MFYQPKHLHKNKTAGYLVGQDPLWHLVKTHLNVTHKYNINLKNIDFLNAQPWEVNPHYATFKKTDSFLNFGGHFGIPLLYQWEDINKNIAALINKQKKGSLTEVELVDLKGLIKASKSMLQIYKSFVDMDGLLILFIQLKVTFYMLHKLDFRGRIYPINRDFFYHKLFLKWLFISKIEQPVSREFLIRYIFTLLNKRSFFNFCCNNRDLNPLIKLSTKKPLSFLPGSIQIQDNYIWTHFALFFQGNKYSTLNRDHVFLREIVPLLGLPDDIFLETVKPFLKNYKLLLHFFLIKKEFGPFFTKDSLKKKKVCFSKLLFFKDMDASGISLIAILINHFSLQRICGIARIRQKKNAQVAGFYFNFYSKFQDFVFYFKGLFCNMTSQSFFSNKRANLEITKLVHVHCKKIFLLHGDTMGLHYCDVEHAISSFLFVIKLGP
jgi:hypothetical protein